MTRTHWTSCSARSPCTVGALAPAAPTSRSSPSSWRSSWRGSLWAGGQRGFLSPPRCPDQTATLWSSSVSPDWPKIRKEHTLLHLVIISFLVTLQTSCLGDIRVHDEHGLFVTSKIFSVCSRFRRDAVEVSSCSCWRRNSAKVHSSSLPPTAFQSFLFDHEIFTSSLAVKMRKRDLEY